MVEVTVDNLNLRSEPSIDPDTVFAILNAGDQVLVISGPMAGEDGIAWCQVRDNRTALTGYIVAGLIRPAE